MEFARGLRQDPGLELPAVQPASYFILIIVSSPRNIPEELLPRLYLSINGKGWHHLEQRQIGGQTKESETQADENIQRAFQEIQEWPPVGEQNRQNAERRQ